MRYLHTMVRVNDIDESLRFYCDGLGLKEVRRTENKTGRFTLVFLAAPEDIRKTSGHKGALVSPEGPPTIELTHNWDGQEYDSGRNFGHLAYQAPDIYALCARLHAMGHTIHRPPRDGRMAFVKSPDGISIELLQAGQALAPSEPWISMDNVGSW